MRENLKNTAIEALQGVKAKVLQSRGETMAGFETLDGSLLQDRGKAVAPLAAMRRSTGGFATCPRTSMT